MDNQMMLLDVPETHPADEPAMFFAGGGSHRANAKLGGKLKQAGIPHEMQGHQYESKILDILIPASYTSHARAQGLRLQKEQNSKLRFNAETGEFYYPQYQ